MDLPALLTSYFPGVAKAIIAAYLLPDAFPEILERKQVARPLSKRKDEMHSALFSVGVERVVAKLIVEYEAENCVPDWAPESISFCLSVKQENWQDVENDELLCFPLREQISFLPEFCAYYQKGKGFVQPASKNNRQIKSVGALLKEGLVLAKSIKEGVVDWRGEGLDENESLYTDFTNAPAWTRACGELFHLSPLEETPTRTAGMIWYTRRCVKLFTRLRMLSFSFPTRSACVLTSQSKNLSLC